MRDVIVVGAGPAGNNTAFNLADRGYDVVVVDLTGRIGDKLCTGIVGRECLARFPIDPGLVHRDVKGAVVAAPGGEAVRLARQDVQAHVVDRVSYVDSLAEKARSAGAEYLLGHRATEVVPEDRGWRVQTVNGSGGLALKARALVLASGFGSDLTGRVGLGRVGDFATGVQAEVMAPGVEDIHVYFGQRVAPGFFAWMVPTSGGRALVGLLCRRRGLGHLQKLVLRLQMEGRVTKVTRAPARWGVPLRPLGRTFGDGVLAVGDSAGQLKPTTGGGIYYALLASEIAAGALHRAFTRGDLSADRLSAYEREWKDLLAREMDVGYSARRMFEVLKDWQINLLMHMFASDRVFEELADLQSLSFDWHSGVIARLMDHPMLNRALTFINPVLATLAPRS